MTSTSALEAHKVVVKSSSETSIDETSNQPAKMSAWLAGAAGILAGLGALAVLIAALMSPHWALVREPIVLAEAKAVDRSASVVDQEYDPSARMRDHSEPLVTTVTFRVGLWSACPHINTTGLHLGVAPPPCYDVRYNLGQISHTGLRLPAPAPLAQTLLAKMRVTTPFLVVACGLLTVGSLFALVGRCCYAQASLVAALMYTLAGLSVGVGVVWFVSVVSEEYGTASLRKTSWVLMYTYRYGWSLLAAGVAAVTALIAALLTGHSHWAAHFPLKQGPHKCQDDTMRMSLLSCRSDDCIGVRSFTSDTIRTYLTCDSRRPQGQRSSTIDSSPSIVDLTKSSVGPTPSKDNSLEEVDVNILQPHHHPTLHHHRCQHSHLHSGNLSQHKSYHQASNVVVDTQRPSSVPVDAFPPPSVTASSSICEPPRLPDHNSFTPSFRTLPSKSKQAREVRQMAEFDRKVVSRSNTIGRSPYDKISVTQKVSSEV